MRHARSLLCVCLSVLASTSISFPASGLPTLSTTATATSMSLDLDGEGSASTHIVKVADITIATANNSGLTLSITSDSLTKSDGQDIAFQVITVANDANAPSSSDFIVPSGQIYTYVTQAAGSESRDVYIRYTPRSLQDPGIYNASLQVSIVDN